MEKLKKLFITGSLIIMVFATDRDLALINVVLTRAYTNLVKIVKKYMCPPLEK